MANEVQFWSITKPDDICPTHYMAEKGQAHSIMNGLPLLLFKLPEMPLFPPESVLKRGEEPGEKMHAHPRSQGHLRPSIFSLTFLGSQSLSGFFMCLRSGGSAL
jgi:hypothetical protein